MKRSRNRQRNNSALIDPLAHRGRCHRHTRHPTNKQPPLEHVDAVPAGGWPRLTRFPWQRATPTSPPMALDPHQLFQWAVGWFSGWNVHLFHTFSKFFKVIDLILEPATRCAHWILTAQVLKKRPTDQNGPHLIFFFLFPSGDAVAHLVDSFGGFLVFYFHHVQMFLSCAAVSLAPITQLIRFPLWWHPKQIGAKLIWRNFSPH